MIPPRRWRQSLWRQRRDTLTQALHGVAPQESGGVSFDAQAWLVFFYSPSLVRLT